MTRLLGTGEGNTVVILTDKESARIREALTWIEKANGRTSGADGGPLDAFNRGIARGTERVKAEFAELQKARKAGAK